MLAKLRQISADPPGEHFVFPLQKARRLRRDLTRVEGGERQVDPFERWRLHFDLGQAEVRLGNTRRGISSLLKAQEVLDGLREYLVRRNLIDANPEARRRMEDFALQTRFYLGVAYLRLGEEQNCNEAHNGEACILPLRGGGLHARPEGSRKAIEYFLQVLTTSPAAEGRQPERGMAAAGLASPAEPDSKQAAFAIHYQQAARWLLNIAFMTLGAFPDQVPGQYLVSPEAFQPEIDFPRFENVAPRLGLDTFNLCGGAIVDDFDNDDYLDIVTSTWDLKGQMRFFRNNGDGTFSDRTEEAGLLGFYGGLNMVQADYDNDGDTDIFVLRGAWLSKWGRHPNSLLSNNGDGTFVDRTFEAGLGYVHYPTKTASWGDYDNDGDLDLFVANETDHNVFAPTQLFRNNGDGTFTDVASQSGVQRHCFGMGTAWGDYDDDRYPDLYAACWPNQLFHNDGDGTFTNVAERLGAEGPKRPFAVWFWDFNNDGALDLLVNSSAGPVGILALNPLGIDVPASDPALRSLQESAPVEIMHLYQNDGDGGFKEVGAQKNLTYPAQPMGANFGDLDNDGYLDFYLATGDVWYSELRPNVMFLNNRGEGFTNVTMAGGFGHLQKGHGVSFADLDNDGDQDVYVQMGGAYPGDKFNDALFENPGFGNHWITVDLEGRSSNRSAIGARIHARIVEEGGERSVFRHVSSGGSFGCNPLRQTLGLGKAERLLKLEVFWPTTGQTQVFEGVSMDQTIRIVEGETRYLPVELKKFTLGGPQSTSAGHDNHVHSSSR